MPATFPFTPSYGSRRSFKPQINMMRFGDGYLQLAPMGINPVVRTYDMTFEKVTDLEADQIETFLADNTGLFFYWIPPGESTAVLWACLGEYSREHVTYNVNRVTVALEQQGTYQSPGARLAPVWEYTTTDWTVSLASADYHLARTASTASIGLGDNLPGSSTGIVRKALPPGDLQIDLTVMHSVENYGSGNPSLMVGLCGTSFAGLPEGTAPYGAVAFVDGSGLAAQIMLARRGAPYAEGQGNFDPGLPVMVRFRLLRSSQQLEVGVLATPGGWPTTVSKTFTFEQLGGAPDEFFYCGSNSATSVVGYSTNINLYLLSAPVFTQL